MIWTPDNTIAFPRTTRIIDVNHDNPITEASLDAAGVDGAIVKLTQGFSHFDNCAQKELALLFRTHRLMGLYHFTEPGDGASQARFFWSHVAPVMPEPFSSTKHNVTLDLERGSNGLMTIPQAEDWVKYIHDECTGAWPLVYGGGGLLRDAFEGNWAKWKNSILLKCGLFLADPRHQWKVITGWSRFALRQCAEDQGGPGWDYDQFLASPGLDPRAALHAAWPLMAA